MALGDTNRSKLAIKSKVWIEDEKGKVVFGAGRLRILEMVETYGSMLAAGKELKMSYRAVWGRIKASEERLGRELIWRKPGGTPQGGSELTPYAHNIMEGFRELQAQAEEDADLLFEKIFASDLQRRPRPT